MDQREEVNPQDASYIKATPRRFFVLVIFCLLLFVATWHVQFFTSLPDVIEECYEAAGVDETDINLSVSLGCLFSLLFMPVLTFVDRYWNNIKVLLFISTLLQLIQILIRMIPHISEDAESSAKVTMMISAILANIGSAFASTLPTRVSSAWFPANERVIATGITSQTVPIGTAVSFLALPLIVTDRSSAKYFLIISAVLEFLLFLLVIFFFPARPKYYPSYSEKLKEEEFEKNARQLLETIPESERKDREKAPLLAKTKEQEPGAPPEVSAFTLLPFKVRARLSLDPVITMFKLLSDYRFVIICLAIILQYGPVQSFAINLPSLYNTIGDDSNLGSYMAFTHLVLNTIGAIFFSTISQKHPKNEKKIVIFLFTVSFVFATFFIFTFGLGSENDDETYDVVIDDMPKWLLSILVCVYGFFTGATIPLFFEVCADMAYPVSAGVTGALVISSTSIGMFVTTLLFSTIGTGYINVICTVGIFISLTLSLFIKVEYKRSAVEAQAPGAINSDKEDQSTSA